MKRCKYCTKSFSPNTKGQVYCSHHCSAKYYNEKNKNQQLANRFWIFERDGFKCVYCGKSSFKDGVVLHIDHVTPVSSNEVSLYRPDNLATACRGCNIHKKNGRINKPLETEIKNHLREKSIEKGGRDIDKEIKIGIR